MFLNHIWNRLTVHFNKKPDYLDCQDPEWTVFCPNVQQFSYKPWTDLKCCIESNIKCVAPLIKQHYNSYLIDSDIPYRMLHSDCICLAGSYRL